MNQVFDMKRWLLFTGIHWNENKKKYLLGLVAIASIAIIWFFIVLMVEPRSQPFPMPMQATSYFIGLFAIGLLFSSIMFSELSEGSKGIRYLMIPASLFEKLLTAIVFSTILFFICYTLVFYAVDFIMVQVANSLEYKFQNGGKPYVQKLVNIFATEQTDHEPEVFLLFFLLYFTLQPAFLLGSVYFSRYSFIKTAIYLLLVCLFFMFLTVQLLGHLMPRGSFADSLVRYTIHMQGQIKVVALPGWIGKVLVYLFQFAIGPFFLLVTYFRLKEKEV